MKQAHKVTTRFPLPSDVGADSVKRLSDLINEVYDEAESGMWKRKGTRTNPGEVERLLRAHSLILAEIEGVLVGSVNVNVMSDGIGGSACSSPIAIIVAKVSDRRWSSTRKAGLANTHVTPCGLKY